MVIRTITCHHAFNQGAMLQAYALATYLKSLGHDVKVIDYSPYYMPGVVAVDFNWVPKRYDYWGSRFLYRLAKLRSNRLEQRRRNALESFFNRYIPVTPIRYASIEELKESPPEADLYIAGSDQIWNTTFHNGTDPAFYLDFGAPKRKISYAASFATTSLKDGSEDFVTGMLRNFDAISVREKSGLVLLRSLGYEGQLVVDPVFLLDRNNWDSFELSDQIPQERYILVYDFDYKGSLMGRLAQRLAKLHQCRIYSVSPFERKYADRSFVGIGPDMFVTLIKHADCILSNSFHGSAFALIYGKDLFVVNRGDGLNIRMKDLLGHLGINHRLIDQGALNGILAQSIDYDQVTSILSRDIVQSRVFLSKQIEQVGDISH